jgi:hypothetical protein
MTSERVYLRSERYRRRAISRDSRCAGRDNVGLDGNWMSCSGNPNISSSDWNRGSCCNTRLWEEGYAIYSDAAIIARDVGVYVRTIRGVANLRLEVLGRGHCEVLPSVVLIQNF